MPSVPGRLVLTVMLAAAVTGGGSARADNPGSTSLHGPDVASYQHPHGSAIDWKKVKSAGASFAFVKATEGNSYTNPSFGSDYAGAHSAGLVRSAYHYARPHLDVRTATAQADYFVKTAGTAAQKGDLPLTLDLEQAGGLSPSELVAWTQAFVSEVKSKTGRTTIIYTYPSFWEHAMGNSTQFSSYPLWIASYRSGGPQSPLPGGWSDWTFWQYTDAGAQPGISGSVDESLYRGSQASLTALADPAAPLGGGLIPPLPIHLPKLPARAMPGTVHSNGAG